MPSKSKIRHLTAGKPVQIAKNHIQPDDAKFTELVLYIARRSEGDPCFAGVKLNKLLFYADFLSYVRFGKPMTGQEYAALTNGPAPKYKVPLWRKMERQGAIAVRKQQTPMGTEQETTLALRDANLARFTGEEIDLVSHLIQICWGKSGSYLSEVTHKFAGWELAKEKETIPYSIALVGSRKPTPKEIRQGISLEASAAACLIQHAAAAS
jgi:uncharacterized phage-associated protein